MYSRYKRMGFIPSQTETTPIVEALSLALPDVLNAPVSQLNFKNVISSLGDVMYKFPFSLPPFYIAIIRCLGVLEGVAIQVDQDFRIISDAYPYIASKLLSDPSKELQAALQQLLFLDGQPRWERLQELLDTASSSSDFDVIATAEQLIAYLLTESNSEMRELVTTQTVELVDSLGTDMVDFTLATLTSPSLAPLSLLTSFFSPSSSPSSQQERVDINRWSRVANLLLEEIERKKLMKTANKGSSQDYAALTSLARVLTYLGSTSRGATNIEPEKASQLMRRVSQLFLVVFLFNHLRICYPL